MNPSPPPSPGNSRHGSTSSIGSPIVFIDGPVNNTWRPRRRDIRGVPPGAFDRPPGVEKHKKKPEDGPTGTP